MEEVTKKSRPISAPDQANPYPYGGLVYIPTYSEIYNYNQEKKLLLSATMSVHNVDPKATIFLTRVEYYDTHGQLIRQNLQKQIKMRPFETKNVVIEFEERKGGPGSNFLVEWRSEKPTQSPIVESVMISTESSLGISFVCQGKVIETYAPAPSSSLDD
ncbi:MAG: DUF3124 domain-containing protein [Microscillaceae bacterium]